MLNTASDFQPKAEYVFRTFCRILGLTPHLIYNSKLLSEEVHIYYGPPTDKSYPIAIYHNSEADTFFKSLNIYPKEKVSFFLYNKEYIPFLFSQMGPIFQLNDTVVHIRKDIISSSFYFLTCWQEYIAETEIMPGERYDYRQSLQNYWEFTEIPVVDRYCDMFRRSLELVLRKFARDIKWPENHEFAISLSHDIDYWNFWTREHLKSTILYNWQRLPKSPFKALYKIVMHALTKGFGTNGYKSIRKIIRKEAKQKTMSTFFLMTRAEDLDPRRNYFNDPETRREVFILMKPRDVGLHGTTVASFDADTLEEELYPLRSHGFKHNGYRNHYLSFDYQRSFTNLEEIEFTYDSTLGYWENIGYRAGTSYPFFPYNLEENRTFHILEVPLIIMDTTLLSSKAMNLTPHKAWKRIKGMINKAKRNHTHISILWHNNTFDSVDYPGWGHLYWRIISYVRKQNGWLCNLQQLFDYWMK